MKRQLMAALTGATLMLAATAPAAENPKPLPETVAQAWRQAGATVGWMGPNQWAQLEFHEGPNGKEGDIAAFRVQHWSPGMLAKLPAPTQPFGLTFWVSNTDLEQDKVREIPENDLTDAGL